MFSKEGRLAGKLEHDRLFLFLAHSRGPLTSHPVNLYPWTSRTPTIRIVPACHSIEQVAKPRKGKIQTSRMEDPPLHFAIEDSGKPSSRRLRLSTETCVKGASFDEGSARPSDERLPLHSTKHVVEHQQRKVHFLESELERNKLMLRHARHEIVNAERQTERSGEPLSSVDRLIEEYEKKHGRKLEMWEDKALRYEFAENNLVRFTALAPNEPFYGVTSTLSDVIAKTKRKRNQNQAVAMGRSELETESKGRVGRMLRHIFTLRR